MLITMKLAYVLPSCLVPKRIILPVLLLSFTLKEEHTLGISDIKTLKKSHNEEFHNVFIEYYEKNQFKKYKNMRCNIHKRCEKCVQHFR
jgi:hypothetical protein